MFYLSLFRRGRCHKRSHYALLENKVPYYIEFIAPMYFLVYSGIELLLYEPKNCKHNE